MSCTRPSSVQRSSRDVLHHPYARAKSLSPTKKRARVGDGLVVGEQLPTLSPEQRVALNNQLLPNRSESFVQNGLTIGQLQQMSRQEGKLQVEAARSRTAAGKKKRLPPLPPAPITEEQRARGRLLRYISLYEDEYRDDILEYMHRMQEATMPCKTAMEQQTEIKMYMRGALLDFLIELHQVFHLRQETLYLAINIMDRYCSRRVVHKKHYQLVGCTALWIAAKYEDNKEHIPTTADLKSYCRDVYEESCFVQMEGHVLNTIDWELGHPTAEAWLRCMVNTLDKSGSQNAKEMAIRQGWVGLPELETRGTPVIMADIVTQSIARFLMEYMAYQEALIDVPTNMLAEAALILARIVNWKTRDRSSESAGALHVARYMHELLCNNGLGKISEALFNKYKSVQFERASTLVSEFYLSTPHDNCLFYLEGLPDLEEMAKANEQAAAAAASSAEVTVGETIPEEAEHENSFKFSDSGYGSSLDASPSKSAKNAPSSPTASQ